MHVRLGGLNRRVFLLPPVCSGGHGGGWFGFSLLTPYSFGQSLMLSAGFGWFSLSGPMVGELVSAEMGATALMTDFFREMFSIIFLYFFGKTQPAAAIGLSGAAAMDSALPFVKENCEPEYVKYAIVSGFYFDAGRACVDFGFDRSAVLKRQTAFQTAFLLFV